MKHFLIFGLHPRLSLAEFISVEPKTKKIELFSQGAVFDNPSWDGERLMNLLGGTVKLGDILGEISLIDEPAVRIIELLKIRLNQKALDYGLTIFGQTDRNGEKAKRLAMQFKQILKTMNISCRWVTGKSGTEIAPAAVAKLNLTSQGLDICVFAHGEKAYVGLTTNVQDADAWSKRDYGRPMRNDRSGMLPPKLARMMVNLAQIQSDNVILDPFCGSGTILMEAALATETNNILGCDIDDWQITGTENNLAWLADEGIINEQGLQRFKILQTDARNLEQTLNEKIDRVITEGYLGPPLTGKESLETLKKNTQSITKLWQETYHALYPLLAKKARLICIWPSFKSGQDTVRVDLSSDEEFLKKYNIINPLKGIDDSQNPLLYHRVGQYVMRRILILEKK